MTGPLPDSHPVGRSRIIECFSNVSLQPLSPSDDGNIVGQPQKATFPPGSILPRQFVYYQFPKSSDYIISPHGRPNTLALKGELVNVTEPAFATNTSLQAAPFTYVARRQDHVLFTTEVTIDFQPNAIGEEAGISLFLNRAQHFDFGIVRQPNEIQRSIRLLTVSKSSSNAGATDPVSRPGSLPLPNTSAPISLRVQATSKSTFIFSYQISQGDSATGWTMVGEGDATEVSGGFTGVGVTLYLTKVRLLNSSTDLSGNVCHRKWQSLHERCIL